jgi:hypothetical protein
VVANVVVLTLTHLLSEYGPVVNVIFAVVAVVMVITLVRKVLRLAKFFCMSTGDQCEHAHPRA